MKLAAERAIKVKGYFDAKDQAADFLAAKKAFEKAFGEAKSLAAAKAGLKLTAIAADVAAEKANESAVDKFNAAEVDVDAAEKQRAASTKVYEGHVDAKDKALEIAKI